MLMSMSGIPFATSASDHQLSLLVFIISFAEAWIPTYDRRAKGDRGPLNAGGLTK